MAIFTGVLWIIGTLTIPETYSPVILQRHTKKLSQIAGKVYKSKLEVDDGAKTVAQELKTALSRPWIILFMEPIVLLLSIYSTRTLLLSRAKPPSKDLLLSLVISL